MLTPRFVGKRAAGVTPDPRLEEQIELRHAKRDDEGRWPLEKLHEVELVNARVRDLDFGLGEREGSPSQWNTLRAMRVLDWYERGR
jgi:hypothetical protein